MAYITKSTGVPCYECSKECVSVQFCGESSNFSKHIRVSITANPEYWGFSGVLISGWATYSNGYYDFFDGFDKDHSADPSCTGLPSLFTSSATVQRPDVFYKSVYDPDLGKVRHYDDEGDQEGFGDLGRGGPEVYLIDRPKELVASFTSDTKDGDPCNDPPFEIFAIVPENFGWGNKILFNHNIYRNISGAWRLSSIENCYDEEEIYNPSGYLLDCSGNYKQNILYPENKYEKYDKHAPIATGDSLYYKYASGCLPDGSMPNKYGGYFFATNSIYRDINSSEFIQARLSYGQDTSPIAASGLKNGMTLGFKNSISGQLNNVYTVFDVEHESSYTSVKLVGTSTGNAPLAENVPTGNFNLSIPADSGHWVAFNTLDPQSCCGLAAYGVSDQNKIMMPRNNYHSDFRRVFNNPKNIRQSNRDREWREDYDLFDSPISYLNVDPSGRKDYTYPSISGVTISGVDYGFVLLKSGETPIVVTGEDYFSGNPIFDRTLPYYGAFYDVDKYEDIQRSSQTVNRGVSKNGTCYTKKATLEIFPDCLTQYDKYQSCNDGEQYAINRVSRLAFVYRGCNFHDDCSFNESGLPLDGWENEEPQNINDLKRLLAGQEIHMFLNLSSAWGGRVPATTPCDCDNPGVGILEPRHVNVHTPATFPNFLNFDLDPVKYGCNDPRHQTSQIINRGLQNTPDAAGFDSEFCDPLVTTEDVFGTNLACLARQPYPTYGYIMSLCGKETNNRRQVIENAFAKIHQEKTYTNENPEDDIVEPMYWNITAPTPAPYSGNGIWGSGTVVREGEDVGPFQQIAGSGYGFWGVSDSNKQVVAPYFCTENGEFISCDTVNTDYVDFSVTGTFRNVLNTSNGWPTDKVPFLIEIETSDECVGCVTKQMKNENLTLELNGLSGEFFFDQRAGQYGNFLDYGRYGYIHCKYGPSIADVAENGKAYVGKPDFTCASGFDTSFCTLPGADTNLFDSYVGNTCQCLGNQEITLYPVTVSGTDVVFGWTSNPDGGAIGLVELSGCNDLASSYFDVGYDERAANGYRVFAEFELACPAMHPFLTTAEYPDAKYEGDPLTTLYANGCPHYYPAEMGTNLELHTTLYLIAESHINTFTRLTEFALKRLPNMGLLAGGKIYPPTPQNFWGDQETNYFGSCPGDKLYQYGCKPEGTYFYGCDDGAGGQYGGYDVCEEATLCNTCPNGSDEGEIDCICGIQVGYEGIIPRPPPMEYQLNECDCLCKDPHLIAEYVVDAGNTGMSPVSGEYADCAVPYWMSTEGMEPIMLSQGTVQPYMGLVLPKITSSVDWYDWSHGVNGLSSGITHDLFKPYRGNEPLPSQNECAQLTIDLSTQVGNVIDCESNTGCAQDNSYYTKTCGTPIYTSGTDDGVFVRKKKCHPEIAIVNKIECLGGNYKLFISREYHEHDRTWKEKENVDDGQGGDVNKCIAVNAGSYQYNDGVVSGCSILPYAVLADSVTPVVNPPCSIHPSSGVYVNQNYVYDESSGQDYTEQRNSIGIFPSGNNTWNHYNLFYSSNNIPTLDNGFMIPSIGIDDSGEYQCDTGIFPPRYIVNTGTIFSKNDYDTPANFYGIFATSGTHSCVQDAIQCGGELWCNKLFFPRHSYKAGTRVAPFGSSQICTGNHAIQAFPLLDGYGEPSGNFGSVTIPTAEPLLREARQRFVDWCNDDYIQEAIYDIDIDDNYLVVNDYLPLLGVVHPGWRYTADVKSCTIAGSGCAEILGLHTDRSIAGGAHKPKTWADNRFDSMGYYIDKFGLTYNGSDTLIAASGGDNCLFNPFKIHIDVECSTNRIARKDHPNDPPTLLQGVQLWDSRVCQGLYSAPGCSCSSTQCSYATKSKPGYCQSFSVGEYIATISTDASGECLDGETPHGGWYHPSVIGGGAPTRTCNGGASPGDWRVLACGEGNTAIRVGPTSIVKAWQCKENQYLAKHPNEYGTGGPFQECDCLGAITEGLCSASYACEDYSSCDCNPVGSGFPLSSPQDAGSASGTWWLDDCECDQFPKDDGGQIYCEPSLVKFTITEST